MWTSPLLGSVFLDNLQCAGTIHRGRRSGNTRFGKAYGFSIRGGDLIEHLSWFHRLIPPHKRWIVWDLERIVDVVIENVEYCPAYIQIRVVAILGAFELCIDSCMRSMLNGGLGVICSESRRVQDRSSLCINDCNWRWVISPYRFFWRFRQK